MNFGQEVTSINNSLLIANLLKQGRGDEVKALFREQEELKKSSESFVSYMDRLISESKMSRSVIVQRSGLSRDYMYKVLRGDKTTTERDYIIAFCMAMKLDIIHTQHALELYPFPVLDEEDIRSGIIIAAIQERVGIDELNEWLEKCGQPLLRTSPDMPSVKVGPSRSTLFSGDPVYSESRKGQEPLRKRSVDEMKIKNTRTSAEQTGMAPVDLAIGAEYEFVTEDGKTLFAQAFFENEISFFAINEVSMYVEQYLTESREIEHYETLRDAAESQYFLLYLELDKLTDKEVAKKLSEIDDTQYYGIRAGARFGKHGMEPFIEIYNSWEPEKCEYVQVRKVDGQFIYSASHRSYYLRYELGPVYEAYYPNAEPEAYLFETESIDDLGEHESFRQNLMMAVNFIKMNFEREEDNNMTINEISRRSVFHTDDYGISGIDSADAEIVVDDNGQIVFLHAQWVSEASDDVHFETTFESTYDLYEKMFELGCDTEALCAERDRVVKAGMPEEEATSRYSMQREELIEMIKEKLSENNIEFSEDY